MELLEEINNASTVDVNKIRDRIINLTCGYLMNLCSKFATARGLIDFTYKKEIDDADRYTKHGEHLLMKYNLSPELFYLCTRHKFDWNAVAVLCGNVSMIEKINDYRYCIFIRDINTLDRLHKYVTDETLGSIIGNGGDKLLIELVNISNKMTISVDRLFKYLLMYKKISAILHFLTKYKLSDKNYSRLTSAISLYPHEFKVFTVEYDAGLKNKIHLNDLVFALSLFLFF